MNQANLEARLSKLERQNQRLKRWGGSLLVAALAVSFVSMTFPNLCKTVWAERFVLRDSQNHDRLVLDAYSFDNPTVEVKDVRGKTVAQLQFDASGNAAILRMDGKGKPAGRQWLWKSDADEKDPSDEFAAIGLGSGTGSGAR